MIKSSFKEAITSKLGFTDFQITHSTLSIITNNLAECSKWQSSSGKVDSMFQFLPENANQN